MPFQIVRNDIVNMEVDAVVNAANEKLRAGGGVCGAIFRAAGAKELQRECDAIGHCPTGQAVITGGYGLRASYIIHAVGPMWRGGGQGEAGLLESCYTSALALAKEHGCDSIAFPLISSGIFGYPRDEALRIAQGAIGAFLLENEMTVLLVVFDRKSFDIGAGRFRSIQSYIDDHYVEQHLLRRPRSAQADLALYSPLPARLQELQAEAAEAVFEPAPAPPPPKPDGKPRSLEDVVGQLDEGFTPTLLRMIDEKGRTDVEVYKRANVDRKLFSKIRNNREYSPRKSTVIAFAVALELSLDETRDLLAKAGFALSHSSKSDVIIEYFIGQGIHDIFEINEALFAFYQPLLGA